MKDLLAPVLAAATEAGARILGIAAQDLHARDKADASPVTAADLAAHHYLAGALAAILPGIPVVSEESGDADEAMLPVVMTAPRYWLVDPLDGTRDFIAGNGEYTVNIALVDGGVPVLGVIVAPAQGLRFAAATGVGAFEYDARGGAKALNARPPSPRLPVALVSRFHQAGEVERLKGRFPDLQLRPCGSSLKYCLIARGDGDFTVRRTPTKLWDTAAAQVVLAAAGGAVTQRSGAPLAYRTGTLLNPPFLSHGAGFRFDAAELATLL